MTNNIKPYLFLVLCGCSLVMLSFGYRAGFGLFMEPLSDARGWGREVLATAFAVQNLVWGVCALLAGGVADRYGPSRVLYAGVIFYGFGMWGMALSTNGLEVLSTAGLLVGAGIAGTSFGIVLPALVKVVPKDKQGWVLGVGTAAGSFGQFAIVPLIQMLISYVGWYQSLQFLSLSTVLMLGFILPLARTEPAGGIEKGDVSFSLLKVASDAFKVPSYLLLVFGFYVCGFHLAFITVHMPVYLADIGFSASVGAVSISVIGLFNIFGAYYAGIFSDRAQMSRILVIIYVARAIVISLFLILPKSIVSVLVFSALIGLLWLATVPPTSGLVAKFFGTRYMTYLYGIVFFSHQVGSFTGVWLGGELYQRFGNYDGVRIAGILLGFMAALLHFYIDEQSYEYKISTTIS